MEKEKMIVRWITKDKAAIDAIRKRFKISGHMTVNLSLIHI